MTHGRSKEVANTVFSFAARKIKIDSQKTRIAENPAEIKNFARFGVPVNPANLSLRRFETGRFPLPGSCLYASPAGKAEAANGRRSAQAVVGRMRCDGGRFDAVNRTIADVLEGLFHNFLAALSRMVHVGKKI